MGEESLYLSALHSPESWYRALGEMAVKRKDREWSRVSPPLDVMSFTSENDSFGPYSTFSTSNLQHLDTGHRPEVTELYRMLCTGPTNFFEASGCHTGSTHCQLEERWPAIGYG